MSRSQIAPAAGFFLYGAFALIAQLVCLQELLIIFAGQELLLGFSLAAWMTWVGMGSWLARKGLASRLGWLIGWSALLLMANIVAIRLSKGFFGFGMLVGLLPMLVLTFVLLAPVGLVVGAMFAWGCAHSHARHRFLIGQAYLWETVGAVCGGVLYSALIAGRLAPEWTVLILAAPATLVAWFLLNGRRRLAAVGAFVLVLFFAVSTLPRWTRRMQWRGYELLAEQTSRYSHLALAKTGSLVSLFENGVISAHFPDPAAYEELVHWPLLAHPAPGRILVIGGAVTGTLSELLKHPVTQIDAVELDPALVRLLRPALAPADRAALDDPRVRLIHRDGRRFLSETAEHYDVILLQLPGPANAQINRLYTLEAFRAVQGRLAPGGLFAFTIPSSEHYLSPQTLYFNAVLFRTLRAAFPSVELVAGDPLLVLAGLQDIRLEPNRLIQRYAARALRTREVVPSYFPVKLDERRRALLASQLGTARLALLNRDFVPVCYAAAWRVWLSKFVSPGYFLGTLLLVALVAALLRVLWRRRAALTTAPGPASLFFLGMAGIVYETVLLLAFQAINGYVYWQLGFLFAAFMLGLALGSWCSVRWMPSLPVPQAHRWLRYLLIATGTEGAFLAWILPAFQRLPIHVPWLIPFGLLLLITGLWLGFAFPLATHLSAAQPISRVAGTLYAADLWGAGLGALVTGAFTVPLIGLIPTVGLTGLLLFLAAWFLPTSKHSASRIPNSAFS